MAIVETTRSITGGVDTHLDSHVVAALDPNGGVLGVAVFPVTRSGYCSLSSWLGEFGTIGRIGVEGTGAYGAGVARHLRSLGVEVIEVDRPNVSCAGPKASPTRLTHRRGPGGPVRPGHGRGQDR